MVALGHFYIISSSFLHHHFYIISFPYDHMVHMVAFVVLTLVAFFTGLSDNSPQVAWPVERAALSYRSRGPRRSPPRSSLGPSPPPPIFLLWFLISYHRALVQVSLVCTPLTFCSGPSPPCLDFDRKDHNCLDFDRQEHTTLTLLTSHDRYSALRPLTTQRF